MHERQPIGERFISSLKQKAMILWVEILYCGMTTVARVMDLFNRLRGNKNGKN